MKSSRRFAHLRFPRSGFARAMGCVWGVGMLLVGACAPSAPEPEAESRTLAFTAMGTVGEVVLADGESTTLGRDTPEQDSLLLVREEVERVEAECSVYRTNSVPSKLARGEAVALSEAGLRLFKLVDGVWKASGGAFDPTVGPLMRLWGFRGGAWKGRELPAPPDRESLDAALAHVGWRKVVPEGGGDRSEAAKGVELDFGGVAKGFAVDEAGEALLATGERKNFLINLGGNIRAWGVPRPGADGWKIAVRDPFRDAGEGSVATLTLTNGQAVATSGCYEQYVVIDGKRHTHILDPRTGWPVRGLAQVTVVAPSAALADALSTACFVLGPEESAAVLEKYPGTSALFVPDEEHGGVAGARWVRTTGPDPADN